MRFIAEKVISYDEYLDLAQNGARILFEFSKYRVFDGDKLDKTTCFLLDLELQVIYIISMKVCYELMALYLCSDVKEDALLHYFDAIAESVA